MTLIGLVRRLVRRDPEPSLTEHLSRLAADRNLNRPDPTYVRPFADPGPAPDKRA